MLHEEQLTQAIIGAAIEVHRALGPGLLESAYQACLERELALREIAFESQKALPVEYKGTKLDRGYRLDLLVAAKVVVELKAVEVFHPIHEAQLLPAAGWDCSSILTCRCSKLASSGWYYDRNTETRRKIK